MLSHPVPLELFFQPQFRFPAFGFHFAAGARRKCRQCKDEIKIIVRCDTIEAFDVAAKAAMNECILLVGALKATNRFHSAAAGTSAVPQLPVINVTRVKTERTVVAMTPSRRRWANETMAMFTLEHLFVGIAMLARVTRLCVMLFTRKYNSPV